MACNVTYTVKGLLYYNNEFVGMRIDLEDDIKGQSLFDLPLSMINKFEIPYTEDSGIPHLDLKLFVDKNNNGVFRVNQNDDIPELTEETDGFYRKMLWYCDEFGYSECFTCSDIEDCSECPLEGNPEGYCGYMDVEGICASFGTTYADTLVGNLEHILEMGIIDSEKYYAEQEEKERLKKKQKEEQNRKRRATALANKDITDEINKNKKAIKFLQSQKSMILSHAVANAMFGGMAVPNGTDETIKIDKQISVLEQNINLLQEKKKERNKERRQKEKG